MKEQDIADSKIILAVPLTIALCPWTSVADVCGLVFEQKKYQKIQKMNKTTYSHYNQ